MESSKDVDIWSPSTGILDIDIELSEDIRPEIIGIRDIWKDQRNRLHGTPALSDFTERMNREWAIETGILEGLYDIDRGVTKTLIEQGFRDELLTHGAANKSREFVLQMIRDQKDALEGVFDFVKQDRPLSTSWIKELHAALLRSQKTTDGIDALGRNIEMSLIRGDWKAQSNSPIREGVTYTYCPPEHVAGEMDRLISMHMSHRDSGKPIEIQAAWLHHRFTQIHPFQDGNGRVARALASLVLVQGGLFPFVVTRDHRVEYIDALEAADRGKLGQLIDFIVKLQKRQFMNAVAISEAALGDHASIKAVLSGLTAAAEKTRDTVRDSHKSVVEIALKISEELQDWLERYCGDIKGALQKISTQSEVRVNSSSEHSDYYFRSQIIENARNQYRYFANLREFRHWISLDLYWRRSAKLVFAIHGVGQEFNGTLICAPFMEFRDSDEDGQRHSGPVPLIEDAFLFFHNETLEDTRIRFHPWRESVFNAAMHELTGNL